MAYVSHSGSSKSSQYDWKVLIFMVLLLISVLIFVAVKFLYPELITGAPPVVSTPVKHVEAVAQPRQIDATSQVLPSNAVAEKKPDVAPKVTNPLAVDEPKSSKQVAINSSNDISQHAELKENENKKSETQNLLCSENDRASGLCQ